MPGATKTHLFLESLRFGSDEVPPACLEEAYLKYLQNICANAKTTNNWAEVRMISGFDTKFMPLSKLNMG